MPTESSQVLVRKREATETSELPSTAHHLSTSADYKELLRYSQLQLVDAQMHTVRFALCFKIVEEADKVPGMCC